MENVQIVVVLLIVSCAIGITVQKFWKTFRSIESNSSPCGDCSSSCDGCELMDLKKEIRSKKEK